MKLTVTHYYRRKLQRKKTDVKKLLCICLFLEYTEIRKNIEKDKNDKTERM